MRPSLQPLEDRCLFGIFTKTLFDPSFLASHRVGVLDVNGTSKNDRILVSADPSDGDHIVISVNGNTTRVLQGHLRIFANRGNDSVQIDLPDARGDYVVTVYGGAGDDTITTANGNDRVFAGEGNDVVNAGGGKDTVYGETGDDFLRGAGGSDLLDGGDGRDTFMGDAGNDHLYGGANPDHLRGGDGNDDLHGGGGIDFLHAEAGDDFLAGDNGTDQFFPGTGTNMIDVRADDSVWDGGLTKSGSAKIILTSNSTYTDASGLTLTGRDGAAWTGNTVTGSDVIVMYTYVGDVNLDGAVNGDDYHLVDLNSAIGGMNGWFNGDFNYDGRINVDDYGIIDSNIGVQGVPVTG